MVDYIVVGSGSGGAAVTRRLVDAGAEVLLIEAGPAGWNAPELADPTAWVSLTKGRYDWGHDYAPTPAVLNRVIPIPRGRVLGGSSATNAMMWYRGAAADHDWGPGWTFADCLPAFRASEDWQGDPQPDTTPPPNPNPLPNPNPQPDRAPPTAPLRSTTNRQDPNSPPSLSVLRSRNPLRGTGGPLRITRSPDPHPLALAMIEGAFQLGIPVIDDPNGPDNHGAALSNLNIANGRRWTSADGYLRPILTAPNLTILLETHALEVLFQGDRATGIAYLTRGQRHETRATRGVILCAGAIETPRLLTLSGIAAEPDLKRLGLPCRIAAPGVGQNLQDHPLLRALNFHAKRPIGPPRDNGGGAILNWKSDPGLKNPDLHAFPVQNRSGVPAIIDHYGLTGDLFAIGAGLMRSHSRGYMTILTTDPTGPLHLQPNFLSDPRDLPPLMQAVTDMMDLAETPAFRDLFAGFAAPDRRLSTPELETFVRRACSTFFHTCGTARMGTDPDAVTDLRLRVQGAQNLWIADASVIPTIPTCNTHAPVTMIGERAAGFILEDA